MSRKVLSWMLVLLLCLSSCAASPAAKRTTPSSTVSSHNAEPGDASTSVSTEVSDSAEILTDSRATVSEADGPDSSAAPGNAPAMDAEPSEVPQKTARSEPEMQKTGSPAESSADAPERAVPFHHTLCFTGDINLAEGQYTTAALDSDGLKSCVGARLRRHMKNADILCINNEFAITDRGTPLEGKAFTFRASPLRTKVLQKLGTDVAIVANNHVFDYGETGLLDTLDALSEAGIAAIGAGKDLKSASAVHYVELEGCTVALLAASRVEWSAQTRPAAKKTPGVFYTAYDTDLLCKRVRQAKKKADYVIVCMHWGMEGTSDLEEYQTQVGSALAEAGADLVVGDHPHQLQGIHFEGEVPVFYSLGNFWFSRKEEYTMLLEVHLKGDEDGNRSLRCQVIPAWQGNARVKALKGDAQREMFDYLAQLPGSDISIDKNGMVNQN